MMRLLLGVAFGTALASAGWQASAARGYRLDQLTWTQAESVLAPDRVVVIPMAAASAEHGPHLQMRSDLILAEYLSARVMQASAVVVAPPITYSSIAGLGEYPGSTSLTPTTARDVVVDTVRSLARAGARRFYVVATSPASERFLQPAANLLRSEGVLLGFARYEGLVDSASRGVRQQGMVGHADEIETSMLLYTAPAVVDMPRAVREISTSSPFGPLTRRRDGQGLYSPSGVWGDATLATAEKGRAITESVVGSLIAEVEALRTSEVPEPPAASPPPTPRTPPSPPPAPARPAADACTPADERIIRGIGDVFGTAWADADAMRLGSLWSESGNIIHPDGMVERGAKAIAEARAELFTRREYRGSRHPMLLAMVRCLSGGVAVADGRWELRGLKNSSGVPLPILEGMCTLVVTRGGGGWQIEAYRYSMKTPTAPIPPNVLKRPGYPGGPGEF
jgi:creatinine amidohydrolase